MLLASHCDARRLQILLILLNPRAPSYLNSRLLGCVTIGYVEPSSHYLGNWSPRGSYSPGVMHRSVDALIQRLGPDGVPCLPFFASMHHAGDRVHGDGPGAANTQGVRPWDDALACQVVNSLGFTGLGFKGLGCRATTGALHHYENHRSTFFAKPCIGKITSKGPQHGIGEL